MFASPEACPSCYRFNADADGVMLFSAFAGVAFGARPIVAPPAGCMAGAKVIARPSEGIGRPKRVKKPTVKQKTVADTV